MNSKNDLSNSSNVSFSSLELFSDFVKTNSLEQDRVKRDIASGKMDAFFFVKDRNGYFRASSKSLEQQIFSQPEKMEISFHDPSYEDERLFAIPNVTYSIGSMFVQRNTRKLCAVNKRPDGQYDVEFENEGFIATVVVGPDAGAVLGYLLKQSRNNIEWSKSSDIVSATKIRAKQLKDVFTAKDAAHAFHSVVEGNQKGFYRLR